MRGITDNIQSTPTLPEKHLFNSSPLLGVFIFTSFTGIPVPGANISTMRRGMEGMTIFFGLFGASSESPFLLATPFPLLLALLLLLLLLPL
jgi:hypothetical protein